MEIRSLSGDDQINSLCMSSMNSVLMTLQKEGYLDTVQVKDFLDNHVCFIAASKGGLKTWFERHFGNQDITRTMCARIEPNK